MTSAMCVQVDALHDTEAHVPPYRSLVQSSRALVGLVVHPPTAAGRVLRALHGALFVHRGVSSALDASWQSTTSTVNVPLSCHGHDDSEEGGQAHATQRCKVLLLDDAWVTSSQVVAGEATTASAGHSAAADALSVTLLHANNSSSSSSNSSNNNSGGNDGQSLSLHWLTLYGDAAHGSWQHTLYTRLATTASSPADTAVSTAHACSPAWQRPGELRIALVMPVVVQLTYRNYTMPQLLKCVLPLCAAAGLTAAPSSPTSECDAQAHDNDDSDDSDKQPVNDNDVTVLSGFEHIGHIAHLNLSRAHLPYRFVIGHILLDCNAAVSVVVNKVAAIASVYREPHLEVIAARRACVDAAVALASAAAKAAATSAAAADATPCATTSDCGGVDSIHDARDVARMMTAAGRTCAAVARDVLLTAVVRQHACVFCVPYSCVYWNSRLSHEHTRLVSLLRRGDVLFDVMAGVGPFAVPVARQQRGGVRVYANDLNPVAAACMRGNAQRNGVAAHTLHVSMTDGRVFLNTVLLDYVVQHGSESGGRCHVIMNLPALAVQFLDVFAPPPSRQSDEATTAASAANNNVVESNDSDRPWYSARVAAAVASALSSSSSSCVDVTKKCVLHVYCFSSAADVRRDAVAQVEASLGYALTCPSHALDDVGDGVADDAQGDVERVHLVRDVSPHKRMVCVSFTLPRAMWQRVASTAASSSSSSLSFVDCACGSKRPRGAEDGSSSTTCC